MGLISRLLKGMGRENQKALESIGLPPVGYQAVVGLPPITWQHYSIGTNVKIVGSPKKAAWRYVTEQNMTGIVAGIVQGLECNAPAQDLYKVRLDVPKALGKEFAYFTFLELKAIS